MKKYCFSLFFLCGFHCLGLVLIGPQQVFLNSVMKNISFFYTVVCLCYLGLVGTDSDLVGSDSY